MNAKWGKGKRGAYMCGKEQDRYVLGVKDTGAEIRLGADVQCGYKVGEREFGSALLFSYLKVPRFTRVPH